MEKPCPEIKIKETRVYLVLGDITEQTTDVIVNAANPSLRGGGGVDGAIHRAGGPKILEECLQIGSCPTGEARLTTGGNLKAKYVIHTVGPIYRTEGPKAPELLARCYRKSLELASAHQLRSVAFPSISTGAYGYPLHEAAPIAIKTIMDYLSNHLEIQLVRLVLFGQEAYGAYEKALKALWKGK